SQAKHVGYNAGRVIPYSIDIIRCVGMEALMCGAVTEVLEDVQRLAKLGQFLIADAWQWQDVFKPIAALFAAKADKEQSKRLKAIEREATPRSELTDGAENLPQLEAAETRDRADDGQAFDVLLEFVHGLWNGPRVANHIEFALEHA